MRIFPIVVLGLLGSAGAIYTGYRWMADYQRMKPRVEAAVAMLDALKESLPFSPAPNPLHEGGRRSRGSGSPRTTRTFDG